MNIFRFEFKGYMRSVLLWAVAIGSLLVMFMAFFPGFSADQAALDEIMKEYPKELLKAFGMDTGLSLATVPGYFVVCFAFVQLCLGIQAANYGFGFLSMEERDLTADFLMSKPVSRRTILYAKLLAAVAALLITNLITWGACYGVIELFRDGKPYDSGRIALLLSSLVLFQFVFLFVGMFLSVAMKKVRSVLTYSISMAFGLYILNAMRSIFGGKVLGALSPFYYFEPGRILQEGRLSGIWTAVAIGVILATAIAGRILYGRRDIPSL